jgi:hypothetical protein
VNKVPYPLFAEIEKSALDADFSADLSAIFRSCDFSETPLVSSSDDYEKIRRLVEINGGGDGGDYKESSLPC